MRMGEEGQARKDAMEKNERDGRTTGPSRRSGRRRCRLWHAATALAFAASVFGADSTTKVPASEIVLVTLTTHGVYSSHAKVKPGRIRLILVNRTGLTAPELQINLQARGTNGALTATPVAIEKPADSRHNDRISFDAVVSTGSHTLGIKGMPG